MNDSNENKTQVKPSLTREQSGDDKTRFAAAKKPALELDEKTRIQPAKRPNNEPLSDKTQFSPQKRPASSRVPAESGDNDPKTHLKTPAPAQANRKTVAATQSSSDSQTVLKGRFVLEELLGAGGMGVVYKAKDLLKIEAQDRDPYVAIKVLIDEFKAHPEAFIALQRESRKTQRIAHPNIVTVYDFDRDGDTVFMTMEYLDGKPLDKLIAQYRSVGLPHDEVVKIIEGMCAALIYAHAQNIIHSDFKPGNIFVSNKGIAKVIDFGIARAVAKVEHREESIDDRTVFDAGNLGALTPAYASLEMLEGKNPDVRDDIYALGCIAYELFTGVHPFNRVHADEAKRQKLKPKKIPGLSRRQWQAIEHALAFERENRTQSVELFWQEFTRSASQLGKYIFLVALLIGGAAGAYYQFKPAPLAPVLSEEQVRSEIEQKLRLEMKKKAIAELYAQASFSLEWENQVWLEVQELRELLGKNDSWLVEQEANFFRLYLRQITTAVTNNELENAGLWNTNALRYAGDKTLLDELAARITAALAERERQALANQQQQAILAAEQERAQKERQQQLQVEKVEAKKHSDFETALANVNKPLACKSTIDMRDFEIAVTKLRSLNAIRYKQEEPKIITLLAQCIQKIGATFPDRAEVIKRQSLRLFSGSNLLANIVIAAKDPCSISLAGFGARGMGSSCRDKLNGATKAPAMVVIPAKGSIGAFAIGKYEVSIDEMNEFCRQSGQCNLDGKMEVSTPVTNISIANATAYLKWLSDKSGRTYRLPTLAEWQYAAKATNGTPDPNRNCKLNSRGIQKGSALNKASLGQQNAWGIVNHLGNAREWVLQPGGTYLAVGGSYDTDMGECNFASKLPHDGSADPLTGFRILREIKN
jgi:serine/threonine protein kinase